MILKVKAAQFGLVSAVIFYRSAIFCETSLIARILPLVK